MKAARLVIGARRSPLSRAQAEWAGDRLRERWPGLPVAYRFLSTAGDRDRVTPLPAIGAKGLFTEELERALRDGRIDVAVHSLKDLPAESPHGVTLAAVPEREDPRDVLVVRDVRGGGGRRGGLDVLGRLPAESCVGTSSLRRAAQLRAHRSDIAPAPIRGNVGTRLRKLDEGGFDALVLAAAGLRRLGLWPPGTSVLDEGWLPAPGQGALGLQCRAGDDGVLDGWGPRRPRRPREVTAEAALLAPLEAAAGTHRGPRPGAGRSSAEAPSTTGRGRPSGATRDSPHAERLGRELAARLLDAGAGALVARARRSTPFA